MSGTTAACFPSEIIICALRLTISADTTVIPLSVLRDALEHDERSLTLVGEALPLNRTYLQASDLKVHVIWIGV